MTSGEGAVARARSMGLTAIEVDGNDIVAVDEIAREYIANIRSGKGPHLISFNTYRLHGHTASDPASYRPAAEVKEAWKKDPIERCSELLLRLGITKEIINEHRKIALEEMERIYKTAREAPWPSDDLAFSDVQDSGDPRQGAF
tara:strand:+ start:139 stop:570 length:432 start_codon:yes stop_codon:yes gene_type:complete